MKFANVVMTTSKVVAAIYRILATSILGYYLIKGVICKRKNSQSFGTERGGGEQP